MDYGWVGMNGLEKNTCTIWELNHNFVNFNINHVQLEREHNKTKERSRKQCTYKKKEENITKKST